MFCKLKRRLVILYGFATSIILTLIITGIFFLTYKQNQEQKRILFQKNVEQVVDKIQSTKIINNSWLAKMQLDNQMIIFILDNGKQLTHLTHMEAAFDTEKSVEKLKALANEDGIFLDAKPLMLTKLKTPIYTFHKSMLQYYLGMAISIKSDWGWHTVIAFTNNFDQWKSSLRQILLFAVIDLIGIAGLFLVSFLYIGKVLRPLEEGQRKQNAFVAAASHELRTPLTVIKAAAASIKEDVGKADQYLPHIEGECNRMTRLISDMLLLASADAKTWSLQKEKLDLDTILIECYDMFCTCRKSSDPELTLDLADEKQHMILGDKERIRQIILILLDNATNYGKDGKQISIRAYNKKNYTVVEVEDHGHGIADDDKTRIFDRFYQGNQSRTDKKHFGLGLSIAKELVELHGGDIKVKDTPGGGATFLFRLPVYHI